MWLLLAGFFVGCVLAGHFSGWRLYLTCVAAVVLLAVLWSDVPWVASLLSVALGVVMVRSVMRRQRRRRSSGDRAGRGGGLGASATL